MLAWKGHRHQRNLKKIEIIHKDLMGSKIFKSSEQANGKKVREGSKRFRCHIGRDFLNFGVLDFICPMTR